MSGVLQRPCQLQKMAENRHFLNLNLNMGFMAAPRLGDLR
jgi:hypothetical protein